MPQNVLDFLIAFVLQAWSYAGVKVIVCHTLINVAVAIAVALKTNSFELGRVGEFLIRKLAPYVLVYYMVKVAGEGAGVAFLAPIVWTVIEATLTGDLLDNWERLGLPLPTAIQRFVVKRGYTVSPR